MKEKVQKKAISILGLLAALLFMTGCASTNSTAGGPLFEKNNIPRRHDFWAIYRQRYIRGRNDCSNKAGRYARVLHEHGYQADVVVIKMTSPKYKGQMHAVVRTEGMYVDPAFGKWSKNLNDFGEFRFTITQTALPKMGKEFM